MKKIVVIILVVVAGIGTSILAVVRRDIKNLIDNYYSQNIYYDGRYEIEYASNKILKNRSGKSIWIINFKAKVILMNGKVWIDNIQYSPFDRDVNAIYGNRIIIH